MLSLRPPTLRAFCASLLLLSFSPLPFHRDVQLVERSQPFIHFGCPSPSTGKTYASVKHLTGFQATSNLRGATWTQSSQNDPCLRCLQGMIAWLNGDTLWDPELTYIRRRRLDVRA